MFEKQGITATLRDPLAYSPKCEQKYQADPVQFSGLAADRYTQTHTLRHMRPKTRSPPEITKSYATLRCYY